MNNIIPTTEEIQIENVKIRVAKWNAKVDELNRLGDLFEQRYADHKSKSWFGKMMAEMSCTAPFDYSYRVFLPELTTADRMIAIRLGLEVRDEPK